MRPLAILVAGQPVPLTRRLKGGFGQLIRDAVGDSWGGPCGEFDCVDGQLPDLRQVSAVVVSGSPESVTSNQPWMARTAALLRQAVAMGVPVLAICFGHQLLAHALGGEVARNPRGREIGTTELQLLQDDPLLRDSRAPRLVNMTHVDSVVRLPAKARVVARTALEPYAALRFSERAWGVQFHPEIDSLVMHHYLDARRELLVAEGLDPRIIAAQIRPAEAGAAVLPRFAEHVARLQAKA